MRIPSRPLAPLLLVVALCGCPAQKEGPTSRQGKEYKTASEGLKEVVPNPDDLPNKKALNNMQNLMKESEQAQERYEHKAGAAGQPE